jgi:hypothetical protein
LLDAADIDLQDLRFRVDLALRLTEAKRGSSEFDLEVPDKVKTAAGAHAKEVNGLARQVADKDITLAEYDKRVRAATEKRFREAYRAGKGSDLDAGDEEWLRRAVDEEAGYAKQFGRDQRSGKGTMSRAQRSAMYGKALEGISLHGAVESLPDDARITWKLGNADHCPDCLVLAASGPYTKWNLPTTPRAGSTKCKTHCQCKLVVRVGKLTAVERKDAERYGGKRREKLRDLLRPRPPKGMRRPDEDESLAIDEMRTKMNFLRRKLAEAREAGADAETIRELARARRDVNDRLIGFLEDRSIYDVPVVSVDEVITGADLGVGAQAEVMRAGLDGATLGLLDDKRLGAMLARFLRLARVSFK